MVFEFIGFDFLLRLSGLVCVMAIRLKSKEVAVVLTAKGRIAILALPAE